LSHLDLRCLSAKAMENFLKLVDLI
jgi:hypothetical protein